MEDDGGFGMAELENGGEINARVSFGPPISLTELYMFI